MMAGRLAVKGLVPQKGRVAARWLAFGALFLLTQHAGALEPEQRESIVISARVWDGHQYEETFVPSSKEEMALISGQDSAIVFVRTLEYYWPLSRRVYVDFERQRELVKGELVIRRDGAVIASEALQRYAILYREGAVNGKGQLLWGQEAERAYSEHQENERRFSQEFSAAQRAHAEYERRLVSSGAARLQGQPIDAIEPPPPLPQPSLRLVTAPTAGFRVRLEPGTYAMAMEQDGHPLPGTRRVLRVMSLTGRAALVADIVPEERWTKPLASNSQAARIYARPGTALYLTLAEATRFDEAEYLALVRPQAEPVAGRPMWVRRRPADLDELQLTWNSARADLLSRQPLKVEQTRGSSFGYRVRATRNDERADLNAFAILVPTDPSINRARLSAERQPQTPFSREVVIVHPRRASLGLALALVPLVAYLAVLGWRRRCL